MSDIDKLTDIMLDVLYSDPEIMAKALFLLDEDDMGEVGHQLILECEKRGQFKEVMTEYGKLMDKMNALTSREPLPVGGRATRIPMRVVR